MAQLNPQKLPSYNALISGTGFVSADVIPLTNYDGLAVCILDGNGNQITTFGGGGSGTQYTYGTVNTTPIGTVAFGQTPSNVLQSLSLDSSGNLKVNIASGSSSGVQYADDVASGATPTGTLGMGWDSINAVVRALKVDTTQNLYVNVSNFPSTQNVNIQNSSIAVTGTFWQATQPVSISGTVATSSAQLPAALDGSGNLKVAVENSPSVSVSNFPSTQPISGTIAVSNFPSTQAVTGTFWQTTQPVSGSVSVSNFPATQAVSWSGQSVAVTGTVTVSGTVASTQSGTWTNTVTQATGTNLHAVIDSGSVTITGTPAISGTVTANQGTANTAANAWPTAISVSGAAIDPRQIRALTSADVVSLPTAQVTTLTPPTAAAIGTAVAADLLTGTQLASASVPVALPTATITTLTPPTAAAIGTAVAAPTAAAIASAIVANPPTTPLPSAQITTLTPPTAAAIGTAVAAPTAAAIAAALTDQAINVAQWDGTPVGASVPFGNNPTFTGGVATNYATTGAPGPTAIAIDASGNAWIVGTSGVIQMAPNGTILQTLTPTGNIRGVAIDGSGNVWVADNTANSIIEYSSTGALLNTYTTGINGPRQIAFDDFGNLWVPNNGSNTLVKLSSAGSVLATVTVGSEPFGIAIDAENNVWIPCNGVNTLVKISNAGTVLGTFPTGASPVGCAVDSVGNIWVANSGATSSVMMFSNLGVLLTTIQIPGSHQLKSPCIDSHGNVWIGDEGASSSVFVFTPAGVLLTTLTAPSGVYAMALDASGNMWGANTVSNQVNKFSPISMSNALGVNAALFSGNVPLTNTAGALNVNVSSGSISVSGTATTTPAAATIQGVSAVTGSASVKTAPIFTAVADGTNVSVLTATGTAPATSTFSLPVASVMYAGATPTALGTPNTFGTTAITGNALGVNASLFMGTTLARTNQTTTATGVVDVNIVGSLGVTNSATNGSFFRLTDNTTALTAAVSSLGTAPTGTGVMAVNSVLLPSAASGASCTLFSNSTVTTAVVAKASAGNLYGCLVNGGTSGNFLQFINASSAPALGTAPVFSIQIPASGIISIPPGVFALDNFTSGISVGISTTYNGASAGTAASVVLFYK